MVIFTQDVIDRLNNISDQGAEKVSLASYVNKWISNSPKSDGESLLHFRDLHNFFSKVNQSNVRQIFKDHSIVLSTIANHISSQYLTRTTEICIMSLEIVSIILKSNISSLASLYDDIWKDIVINITLILDSVEMAVFERSMIALDVLGGIFKLSSKYFNSSSFEAFSSSLVALMFSKPKIFSSNHFDRIHGLFKDIIFHCSKIGKRALQQAISDVSIKFEFSLFPQGPFPFLGNILRLICENKETMRYPDVISTILRSHASICGSPIVRTQPKGPFELSGFKDRVINGYFQQNRIIGAFLTSLVKYFTTNIPPIAVLNILGLVIPAFMICRDDNLWKPCIILLEYLATSKMSENALFDLDVIELDVPSDYHLSSISRIFSLCRTDSFVLTVCRSLGNVISDQVANSYAFNQVDCFQYIELFDHLFYECLRYFRFHGGVQSTSFRSIIDVLGGIIKNLGNLNRPKILDRLFEEIKFIHASKAIDCSYILAMDRSQEFMTAKSSPFKEFPRRRSIPLKFEMASTELEKSISLPTKAASDEKNLGLPFSSAISSESSPAKESAGLKAISSASFYRAPIDLSSVKIVKEETPVAKASSQEKHLPQQQVIDKFIIKKDGDISGPFGGSNIIHSTSKKRPQSELEMILKKLDMIKEDEERPPQSIFDVTELRSNKRPNLGTSSDIRELCSFSSDILNQDNKTTTSKAEMDSNKANTVNLFDKDSVSARMTEKESLTSKTGQNFSLVPPKALRKTSEVLKQFSKQLESLNNVEPQSTIVPTIATNSIHDQLEKSRMGSASATESSSLILAARRHIETTFDTQDMSASLSEVSLDPLFLSVLSLKLSVLSSVENFVDNEEEGKSKSSRYFKESIYIDHYQEMLLEEIKADMKSMVQDKDTNSSANRPSSDSFFVDSSPLDIEINEFESRGKDSKLSLIRAKLASIPTKKSGKSKMSSNLAMMDSALKKDDLVMFLDPHTLAKHPLPEFDFKRSHSWIRNLTTLPYEVCLGIVISSEIVCDLESEFCYVGLLVVNENKEVLSTTKKWCVSPIMKVTSCMREWAALHSISHPRLMPLAPYLLQGTPCVSYSLLQFYNDSIKSKMRQYERLKSTSNTNSVSWDRELSDLKQIRIDMSLLMKVDIPATLKKLSQLKINSSISSACEELLHSWKQHCSVEYSKKVAKTMSGGVTIDIPEDVSEICRPDTIPVKLWEKLTNRYNPSQLYAIRYICANDNPFQDTRISLVQGPPGTGKTSTVLGMISSLLSKPVSEYGNRVRLLVCTPSNAAVDEILSRLINGIDDGDGNNKMIKLIRLGDSLRPNSTVEALSLDYQVEVLVKKDSAYAHFLSNVSEIESLGEEVALLRKERIRCNGHLPADQFRDLKKKQERLKNLYDRRSELKADLDRLRYSIRNKLLLDADVVASTLSGSGKQVLVDHLIKNDLRFPIVLIDEAAQTTEPSSLIPLRYGCEQLVLVGDPRQLPATVKSLKARSLGLGVSLFERLEKIGHPVVMLNLQYRMHPDIRLFPSDYFYQGKLIDASCIEDEVLECATQSLFTEDANEDKEDSLVLLPMKLREQGLESVCFCDLSGYSQECRSGTSFFNPKEASFILNFLHALAKLMDLSHLSIGIISPYKGQVLELRTAIKNLGSSFCLGGVEVDTIDAFQGREKDIIIFSCVKTQGSIEFLSDPRRFNVAITRSKRFLLIVGHRNLLWKPDCSKDSYQMWASFLKMCEDRGWYLKCNPSTSSVLEDGEISHASQFFCRLLE